MNAPSPFVRALLGLMLAPLVAWGLAGCLRWFQPETQVGLLSCILGVGFMALIHGLVCLGARRTLTLLALVLGLGVSLEWIRLHGVPLGTLTYGRSLGPQLAGLPVCLPLGWFGITYLAHALVNLVLQAEAWDFHGSALRTVWAALLTGLVLVALVALLDPILAGVLRAWTWAPPGEAFGTPFVQLAAWGSTGFLVSHLYRSLEKGMGALPEPGPDWRLELVPLGLLGLLGWVPMSLGAGTPVALLAPYVLGSLMMAALGRLVWRIETTRDAREGGLR